MGYLFNPPELVSMFESLGIVKPSVFTEDGVTIFPCGVQCQRLLGQAIHRGNVNSVYVSKTDRYITIDFDWVCVPSQEFRRWSRVQSFRSRIPYHKYYYQCDEDRVKLKFFRYVSVRFFRMDDYTHIIDTGKGFVSRWYLPKMALFRMLTIALLNRK